MRFSLSSIWEWIRFWISIRVVHVGEALLAALGTRLDEQVAGTDDAFDDRLVEVDAVDPLEGDLDTGLGEHTVAEDHAVAGDHEVRRDPLEVADDDPHGAGDDQGQGDPPDLVGRVDGDEDDPEDDRRDEGEDDLDEVQPMRVQIDCELLVVVEQLLRIRHGPHSTGGVAPAGASKRSHTPPVQ